MKLRHALAGSAFFLATPAWGQVMLPDGPGRELVGRRCGDCHAMSRVTEAGYSPEGWRNNLHMMKSVGATIPSDEIDAIVTYLAKNFPEKPRPAAVVVPGDAKISIREWFVPTAGSRPHDPLPTADGALWYTGQFNNVLGRLDPKSGEVKLAASPTPRSRPYGILVNSKNVPFWVDFGTNKVASIDRDTLAIREYALPDAAAASPSRPTTTSGTPTTRAGTWAASTRRPARSLNGHHPGGRNRSLMEC